MSAREIPILFSAPMVLALLDGSKVQTRRLVKGLPGQTFDLEQRFDFDAADDRWKPIAVIRGEDCVAPRVRCPYGRPGDTLWVKETWRPSTTRRCTTDDCKCGLVYVTYAADGAERTFADETIPDAWMMPKAALRGNVTPLFMPRWASRITLALTEVRVERLQAISEADACAEGMGSPLTRDCKVPAYAELWDALNGKIAPWASNPFVWVLTFKRVQAHHAD